jgi:hypothetical protein
MDLGGTWQATLDAENQGEQEGWFKPEFAAEGWRQVKVPGSFANVAPEIDGMKDRARFGAACRPRGRADAWSCIVKA